MNSKNYKIIMCVVVVGWCLLSCSAPAEESFIVESAKTDKEKKYSELHEELILELEDYLQTSTQLLHKLAASQKKALDELRKIIENMPKMSRPRLEKELNHIKKLHEKIATLDFF